MTLDLPEPESDFDAKVLDSIHRYGWHCLRVDDAAHPEHAEQVAAMPPDALTGVPFAYTIGLPLTHGHAELILAGAWTQWHPILQTAVELIVDGTRFAAGDESDDVLEDYPVRFGAVSEQHRKEFLTFADWAARRRPFEALQVLLPDRAGVWPGGVGYAGPDQPLLA